MLGRGAIVTLTRSISAFQKTLRWALVNALLHRFANPSGHQLPEQL
jgi:hypothetical protein